MDLATRKYNFIQQLIDVDENLLEKLEQVLEIKKNPKAISLKQYNAELSQANLRIENGDFFSGEEVEKMASEW